MSLEMVTAYRKSNALFSFVDSEAPLHLSTQDGKTVEQLSPGREHTLINICT